MNIEREFGSFTSTVAISFSSAGDLYVADAGENSLHRFSSDGVLLGSIGGKGWGNLQFDQPADVCASFLLDVYVADYNNRRVQQFDRFLNYIQTIDAGNISLPISGSFIPVSSVLSSRGELFVLDSDGRSIIKFSSKQKAEREFGSFDAGRGRLIEPKNIDATPEDDIVVLDKNRCVVFDLFGNYKSTFPIEPREVIRVRSASNGFILVTTDEIVVLDNEGRKKFSIMKDMLAGEKPIEQFRDAAVWNNRLYIATVASIIVIPLKNK